MKLRQIFDFVRTYYREIIIYSIITFFSSFLEGIGLISLIPLLSLVSSKDNDEGNEISDFTENIFSKLNLEPSFNILITFILILSLSSILLRFLAKLYTGYTQNKIMTDHRMQLINSVKEVGWEFYSNLSSGYLLNLVMRETLQIGKYFSSICSLLSMFFQIIAFTFVVIIIDPQIIIMLILAGIIMFSTLSFIIGKTGKISKKLVENRNFFSKHLIDFLGAAKTFLIMGINKYYFSNFIKLIEDLKSNLNGVVILNASLELFQELIKITFGIFIIYFLLQSRQMEFEIFIVLFITFVRGFTVFQSGQKDIQRIFNASYSLKYVESAINESTSHIENFEGEKRVKSFRKIIFKKVEFSYKKKKIFKNLNLQFFNNSFLCIIGPSGSGKTTFIDLISGLIKAESGNIFVDKFNINSIDIKAWRGLISHVPQDVFLFNDTVFKNIVLENKDLSEKEVNKFLKIVGLTQNKYGQHIDPDYLVGEQGRKLSGGQKQKIAIARALIRKPKILILDEPFSSLDSDSRKQILDVLIKIKGKYLIIVTTHEKELMSISDLIFKIDKNQLINKTN